MHFFTFCVCVCGEGDMVYNTGQCGRYVVSIGMDVVSKKMLFTEFLVMEDIIIIIGIIILTDDFVIIHF